MEAIDYGLDAQTLDYIRAEFPAFKAAEDAPRETYKNGYTPEVHLPVLLSLLTNHGYTSRNAAKQREQQIAEDIERERVRTGYVRANRIIDARIPHDKLTAYDARRAGTERYSAKLAQLCAKRTNWIFSGPTGSGKSMTAAQVLLHWMDQGASIYWLDMVGFYDLVGASINNTSDKDAVREIKIAATRASVLCVDDLGKEPLHKGDEKSLTYFGGMIHTLAEQRRAQQRTNIVTSKYTMDELGRRCTVDIMARLLY